MRLFLKLIKVNWLRQVLINGLKLVTLLLSILSCSNRGALMNCINYRLSILRLVRLIYNKLGNEQVNIVIVMVWLEVSDKFLCGYYFIVDYLSYVNLSYLFSIVNGNSFLEE